MTDTGAGKTGDPVIRRGTGADLDGITRVHDRYIVGSAVSFDTEPRPSERRRALTIAAAEITAGSWEMQPLR